MDIKKQNCENEVCEVLHSIALEEAAIAHILNAEGEKIQKAVSYNAPIHELLKVNDSVTCAIKDVTSLEIVLVNKLQSVMKCSDSGDPPQPCNKGSIKIRVINCATHSPLKNAEVFLITNSGVIKCQNTDSLGISFFDNLDLGDYCVKVCYQNFHCKTESVKISSDDCHQHYQMCFEVCSPIPLVIEEEIKKICICGYVCNACGAPLRNAKVEAKGLDSACVSTDCNGCYQINNFAVLNSFSLSVNCCGYKCQNLTTGNLAKGKYVLNFNLTN